MSKVELMPRDVVEKKLSARGAKITTVVYQKTNGDVVRQTGMPKVYKRRVGNERGKAQALGMRNRGQVFFDLCDPDPADGKTGFSFYLDRVVHI